MKRSKKTIELLKRYKLLRWIETVPNPGRVIRRLRRYHEYGVKFTRRDLLRPGRLLYVNHETHKRLKRFNISPAKYLKLTSRQKIALRDRLHYIEIGKTYKSEVIDDLFKFGIKDRNKFGQRFEHVVKHSKQQADLTEIPDFPGYFLTRDNKQIIGRMGNPLSLHQNKGGYWFCCASVVGRKGGKPLYLHWAIARCRVKGYRRGRVVHHKDCDNQNNHPSNLMWVTVRYNNQHQKRSRK